MRPVAGTRVTRLKHGENGTDAVGDSGFQLGQGSSDLSRPIQYTGAAMRPSRLTILVLALVATSAPLLRAQAAPAASIKVMSAQRATAYGAPSREVKARDESVDVVIVVKARGLTREEFQKLRQQNLFIKAGDEELPPIIVATGVIEGEAELLVVTVGPKAILAMTLHLGEAQIPFTADEAILESVR